MFLKLTKYLFGLIDKISSNQEPILSTIKGSRLNFIDKNLDPGRGWFYQCYESDNPLITTHQLSAVWKSTSNPAVYRC